MFTTLDQLVSALGNLQRQNLFKLGATVSAVTTNPHSTWRMTPGEPAQGGVPGSVSGAACDKTTTGALPLTAPGAGNELRLARWTLLGTIACAPFLMDRMVHTSGLSGTVLTEQAVNSAALPARAGAGTGLEMYLECYTALGATTKTVTARYTNSAGVTNRTTGAATILASHKAGDMLRLPLQAGDVGVQSVQGVTLSGSTGTAGDFGITLCKRIAGIRGWVANTMEGAGPFQLGLPLVDSNACLFVVFIASSTTTPNIESDFYFAEAPV